MQRVIEFMLGLTFGLGLLISGMTDPGKVQGFLDVTGAWDPSLAFVMAGGVMVGFIGFGVAKKKTISLSGAPLQWPEMTHIDKPLVLGSLMFGLGWGLAGYCPGPALVSMASGNDKALVFVLAMMAGMALFERFKKRDN
jgi:uncharacterized membrane protein YedE/YeeE